MLNPFGLRPFAEPHRISDIITKDNAYDRQLEPRERLRDLLIFATSTQQTWLVFSPVRVYCVLDNREREEPVLRWSMTMKDFLKASINVRDHSAASGALDIGDRKDWLFSKRLFPDTDIRDVVRQTAADAVLQSVHAGAASTEPAGAKAPATSA